MYKNNAKRWVNTNSASILIEINSSFEGDPSISNFLDSIKVDRWIQGNKIAKIRYLRIQSLGSLVGNTKLLLYILKDINKNINMAVRIIRQNFGWSLNFIYLYI